MTRPIWNGTISFGLINIPVTLYSAEKTYELHFHLLDKKNNARIHYERINAETGKKVDWNDIVKAYEFEKGNFIIVDEKEMEKDQAENFKTIDLTDFVDKTSIDIPYYDKPYYLVPSPQGKKGYQLLYETLMRMKKIGIAKVVIKTKQHIAALVPYKNLLLLNLLRFQGELQDPSEFYQIKDKKSEKHKITKSEISMAERLIESMTSPWNVNKYHDESREMLKKWIDNKIKKGKSITAALDEKQKRPKATVIDFMELLKKSIKEKEGRRTRTLKNRPLKLVDKKRKQDKESHKREASKTKRSILLKSIKAPPKLSLIKTKIKTNTNKPSKLNSKTTHPKKPKKTTPKGHGKRSG